MWNCHYERSEESAVVCAWNDGWGKQQFPHRLNFAPASAKTALVGDPCPSVRDDKKIKGSAYVQDVTTLLPAFGLGHLVARKFHHSVARWIWVPAIALWLLVVLPDVASYTGQNCDLSRTQYFLHEFVFDIRTNCDEGLAWPLYTLPALCCIGYSLGAKFAANRHPPNSE